MRGSAALLAAALWCGHPTGADAAGEPLPETRAEQWTRLRREKAARAKAPTPGFLERTLLAAEQAKGPSLFSLNLAGFHPSLQYIASGSQLAAGLRFWRPDMGGSAMDLHASAFYSIHGYEYYDLQLGRMAHRGKAFPAPSTKGDDVYELGALPRLESGRTVLYGSARYRHYPRTRFYGLGADTEESGVSDFLSQDALYEVVGGYEGPRFTATARAGLMQAFVGPGTDDELPDIRVRYDDQSAPGLDRQPDFVHLTARVLYDARDEPGNPHRGGMMAVAASRFDERGGDEFTFDRVAADARGFASLGSPQRVLALRVMASADRAASGRRVPFYLMEPLGGSHTLRGFRTYRFRGEKLLLLQAEYRWETWPALELALFADTGRVYAPGESFAIRDLESDVGFGVRFKTHDAVLARLDVAFSSEDTRFLFRFGPAF